MTELVFPGSLYDRLATALLSGKEERAAVVFARVIDRGSRGPRFLVRNIEQPPDDAYLSQGPANATLSPAFVLRATRRANEESLALVFVHTHPFSAAPSFSSIDDQGEATLAPFLQQTCPGRPHVALVIGHEHCAARILGTQHRVDVVDLGHRRIVRSIGHPSAGTAFDDRQVRAFGQAGQSVLRSLHVAVVGVGGTGSLVAQQLAHLGVGDLLLVDPDTVEHTNINRVVGATWRDCGAPKAVVLARTLDAVRPDTRVRSLPQSILQAKYARMLAEADFIFCCTDTHGSRAVIGQLAYQYLIPTIDVGVAIWSRGHAVTHIAGRVHTLVPPNGCLVCAGILDPAEVRRDLMSDAERASDPYFRGPGTEQPAVIAFNSVVAGTAVAAFLWVVTGVGTEAELVNYNGISGNIRVARTRKDAYCVICSEAGVLGRGDSEPLPARYA